jgi:hypothetical protein
VFVDPAISRKKFEREIQQFRAEADRHHKRGIWLMEAVFPKAFLVFTATQTKPLPMVIFGAEIDFEDYDAAPASLSFVDPVNRKRLSKKELLSIHPFAVKTRRMMAGPILLAEQPELSLIQGFDDDKPPFACLPGLREYHDHPGHTGDSWWLHRKGGEGTLSHIVEQLARFGLDCVRGVNIELKPVISGVAVQLPQ